MSFFHSDDLFPTCGATHGLYLLASQYFGPGDVVFVEELSFFLAVDMLSKDLKMKAVPGMYYSAVCVQSRV